MTILSALKAQVQYPLSEDFFLSIPIKRNLDGNGVCTSEVMQSAPFIGAHADCLKHLATCPSSISEGGMSISNADRQSLTSIANKLYRSIGEEAIGDERPKVTFY